MNRQQRRATARKTNKKTPLIQIKNVSADTAELYMYGFIDDESFFGDEVTPDMVREKIANLGDIENLNIYINSPGGSVFAGIAIYNMLRRVDAYTTAYIDGECASAATYPAIACDKIVMPTNTEFMIHNSSACVCGNAQDMIEISGMLQDVDKKIINMYVAKTGTSSQEIAELMNNETTMDAEEAMAYGFIDEVDDLQPKNKKKPVKNRHDKVEYANTNLDKYRETLKDFDGFFNNEEVDNKPEEPEQDPETPETPETPEIPEIPEDPKNPENVPQNIDYSILENNIKLTETIIKSLGGLTV